MKRLLVLLFCVLYAIGGKAHVDCVRDGSEHEAKRSKAYSPTSSKRLESNIDKKTIELASSKRLESNKNTIKLASSKRLESNKNTIKLASSKRLESNKNTIKLASLTRARPEGETSVSDTISLSLSNLPMLNMPFDKENIPVQLFQNINFSWTPLHMGSINAAFSTEYLFELWEIYNEQVPPQQYVQTAQPLYSTTTSSPILIYGPTMPMLIEGKRYAWRVRVQAKKGFDDLELFTNQGYSQVWSFTYAANCPEPSQVLLTSPFPDQIKVQWAYQNTYQQTKISYREAGKSKWYHETTTDPEYYITQLKDNTEYEVKIAGICTGGIETYSQPATIKTQEKGKTQIPNFNCGTPPKKLDLSNKSPLASLNAGETVTAGDFEITITEARGGGGTYSGKGYMRVPYFKLARLAITFQNVQINTSRQLIGGYFQAVYDEANGSIVNTTEAVKAVGELIKSIGDLLNLSKKIQKDIEAGKKPAEADVKKLNEGLDKNIAFLSGKTSSVSIALNTELKSLKENANNAAQGKGCSCEVGGLILEPEEVYFASTEAIVYTPKETNCGVCVGQNNQQIEKLGKELEKTEGEKEKTEGEDKILKAFSLFAENPDVKAFYLVRCTQGAYKYKNNQYKIVTVNWNNSKNEPLKIENIDLADAEKVDGSKLAKDKLQITGDLKSFEDVNFLEWVYVKVNNEITSCRWNSYTPLGNEICKNDKIDLTENLKKGILQTIQNCNKTNGKEGEINTDGEIYVNGKWETNSGLPVHRLPNFKGNYIKESFGLDDTKIEFRWKKVGAALYGARGGRSWYEVYYKNKKLGEISAGMQCRNCSNTFLSYETAVSDYYKSEKPTAYPKEAEKFKGKEIYFDVLVESNEIQTTFKKGLEPIIIAGFDEINEHGSWADLALLATLEHAGEMTIKNEAAAIQRNLRNQENQKCIKCQAHGDEIEDIVENRGRKVEKSFQGEIVDADGRIIIKDKLTGKEVSRGELSEYKDKYCLKMTLKTKGSNISGRDVIKKTIEYMEKHFEVKIEGFDVNWVNTPKLEDNIKAFNESFLKYKNNMTENEAMRKAYWDTYSGKMAKVLEFNNLDYITGTKNQDGFFVSIKAHVLK